MERTPDNNEVKLTKVRAGRETAAFAAYLGVMPTIEGMTVRKGARRGLFLRTLATGADGWPSSLRIAKDTWNLDGGSGQLSAVSLWMSPVSIRLTSVACCSSSV